MINKSIMNLSLDDILSKKGIDSRTLSGNADFLEEKLVDTNTKDHDKIRIGDYFCRRLYQYLHRKRVVNIINDVIPSVIFEGNAINKIMRLSFLKWLNREVVFNIAKYQYDNQIDLDNISYLQILSTLLRCVDCNYELKNEIIGVLNQMFDQTNNILLKNNIADIMRFVHRSRGEEMLENLRMAAPHQEATIKRVGTIYSDSQNVHNSTINQSENRAARELVRLREKSSLSFNFKSAEKELIDKFPEFYSVIEDVLERIQIDTTIFNSGYTLAEIFEGVWIYIQECPNSEHQESMFQRLHQEFQEMNGYCSTGHMSRLINIIQGFTTNPKLQLRISDDDRLRGIIYHRLNTKAMEREDVMDSLMEDNTHLFNTIIKEIVDQIILDLRGEGEHINLDVVIGVLKKYANTGEWSVKNNEIVLKN